jgi:hypothetical protein
MVKEDSVSRQSSIDLFRYDWIHLLAAIVKEDSVSRQSSIDLFGYSWIHLLPYGWIRLLPAIDYSKGGQYQSSIYYRYVWIHLPTAII